MKKSKNSKKRVKAGKVKELSKLEILDLWAEGAIEYYENTLKKEDVIFKEYKNVYFFMKGKVEALRQVREQIREIEKIKKS